MSKSARNCPTPNSRIPWRVVIGAIALLNAVTFALPAHAADEDDPVFVRGRALFTQCRGCHTTNPRQASLMKGPGLWGIIGRAAGSLPGYTGYSEAMLKSGVTWTPETLDKYLTSPGAFIPGNNMAFIGLPKPEDRKAVVAYLSTVASAPAPAADAAPGEAPAVLTLKKYK